jgi:DNA-binding CsgD family transcriptional regulator
MAVEKVQAGSPSGVETGVDPALEPALHAATSSLASLNGPAGDNPLSEREMEVSRLLVTGASNAEIARALVISPHTVKVHLRNVFEKLHVNSRTEASMVLLQRGWLTMPGVEVALAAGDAATALDAVPEPQPLADLATQPALWQQIVLLIALLLGLVALTAPSWISRPKSPVGLLSDSGQTVVGPPAVEGLPRWENRTPLAEPRSRLSSVALGGLLYVMGGENADGQTLAALDIYDLGASRWLSGAPLPEPLANPAVTAVDGRIVLAGGSINDPNVAQTVTVSDDLYVYDPVADAWQPGGSLPRPLAGAVLVTVDDALYLIGGWDGSAMHDEIWRLPISALGAATADDWRVLTRLQTPAAFLGATAMDGELVVAGGYDGRRELASAAAFDLAEGRWRELPAMTTPRSGHALIFDGVAVQAVGGGWTRTVTANERYDALTNQWKEQPSPIRGEWRHFGAALHEGSIYLIGGWSGDYLDTILQYQSTFRALLPAIPNVSN